MRSPRIRFTVRGLMIAVAIAAVVSAVVLVTYRAREFRSRANRWALMEAMETEAHAMDLQVLEVVGSNDGRLNRHREFMRASADRSASDIERYARLRRKYEYAARHPWLPVAPDPP